MPYIGKKPADIIATAVDTTTGTFSGAVTAASLAADGGITVDNISIDATEIDLSSGSFTIDSAANITLDCGTGEFLFNNGGNGNLLKIQADSSNVNLITMVQDKDLVFKGNDGGSTITALTLDMSAAGLAIFNAGVALGGTGSANTLDDYEEGTFTPTLISSSGGARSVDGQSSRYTKIGRICYISCAITTIGALSGSNSGTLRLGGLPFNYNGSVSKSVTSSVSFVNVNLPADIIQTAMLQNSSGTSNNFFFSSTFDNSTAGELGISAFGTSSSLVVSLVYEVA